MIKASQIAGFGYYAPGRKVENSEIEQKLGLEPGWIFRRTGIFTRRWVDDGESLGDRLRRRYDDKVR